MPGVHKALLRTPHKVRRVNADVRPRNMKSIITLICLVTGIGAFAYTNVPPGSINDRLDTSIIPACVFREANAVDVLEYIVSAAIYIYPGLPTVSLGIGGHTCNYPEIFDHTLPSVTNLPPISINVRRMPHRDLLNNVTKALNLRYKVTDTSILIYTDDGILLNKQ